MSASAGVDFHVVNVAVARHDFWRPLPPPASSTKPYFASWRKWNEHVPELSPSRSAACVAVIGPSRRRSPISAMRTGCARARIARGSVSSMPRPSTGSTSFMICKASFAKTPCQCGACPGRHRRECSSSMTMTTMTILELVQPRPDWLGALQIALTRPPGVPERRSGEDPWKPAETTERPRRISDDLAWFRDAMDEPQEHGLRPLDDTATVAAWESADPELVPRLSRLEERGVLAAAGFLLHEPDAARAAM